MCSLRSTLFALFVLWSFSVSATVSIEPYVGYQKGEAEPNDDISGYHYGGRLGLNVGAPTVGLNYMTGKWKLEDAPKTKYTPTDLGIFLAFQVTNQVRLYGEFVLDAELKQQNGGKFDGHGLKFGLGISLARHALLNFEYSTYEYDEHNGSKMGQDLDINFYGLSLAFPFTL